MFIGLGNKASHDKHMKLKKVFNEPDDHTIEKTLIERIYAFKARGDIKRAEVMRAAYDEFLKIAGLD